MTNLTTEQDTTSAIDTLDGGSSIVGAGTGVESSLSNWAGDYVTNMLGKGQALGEEGYNAYMGPLTAGESTLHTKAFEGIGGLALPSDQMGVSGYTPQTFTGPSPDISAYGATGAEASGLGGMPPNLIAQYMNPYLRSALDPQIADARRQSEIDRIANASRMTKAGSFGGSRQAVLDAENQAALQRNIAGITGAGYRDAYDKAASQFNIEQDRGITTQDKINKYGLDTIGAYTDLGEIQRGIESEGIEADRLQFEEERDFPYKQVQYLQSLLQGMPIEAKSYSYAAPSELSEILSGAGGIDALYKLLFPDASKPAESTSAESTSVEGTTE